MPLVHSAPLRLIVLALVVATPLVASAEEGGRISATIDGEERSYVLTANQSDWSGWGNGAGGSTNIFAGEEGASGGWSDFTLGFSYAGDTASDPELSARLGDGRYFGEDEETGLALTLTSIEIDGDFLTVAGSFEGEIGKSDNYGRDIDTDGRKSIFGEFEVTLGPVE